MSLDIRFWHNHQIWERFREVVLHQKKKQDSEGLVNPDGDPLNELTRTLIVMVYNSDSVSQAGDPAHCIWDLLHEMVKIAADPDHDKYIVVPEPGQVQ